MSTREVAQQFDEISTVYDETREPLDSATVGHLADALAEAKVGSLLEVGIGTGRVAKPLLEHGFTVTGLDASLRMLEKARAKGLSRLVRGSAYRLPFRDRAFDATLFVHVLHIFEMPAAAIVEAARVGRQGAYALVHPMGEGRWGDDARPDNPRAILRDVLAEQGFPLPRRPWRSPMARERELLKRMPPDRLVVVNDREVTETVRSRLERMSKRGHRMLLEIPPEALRRAVETARERVGDRTVTYRSVEALARWQPSSAPGRR